MKNYFLSIFTVVLMSFSLQGQHHFFSIENNSLEQLQCKFTTPALHVSDIKVDGNYYSLLEMDDFFSSASVGNPMLPVLGQHIEIPLCDNVQVEVISSSFEVYSGASFGINHEVYPAQPSRLKSEEGPFPIIKSAETYATNAFFGEPLVKVEKTGVMRSFNLATLYIAPVQYNPVTNEVKIYREITLRVTCQNADIPATYEMKNLHSNGVFMGAQAMVLNPIAPQNRDEITTAPIKYLIVAHAMFRNQLDAFVTWKQKKGFLVEIAYTDQSEVGTTTTSIKNFILSKYTGATLENPAPTYVLLVGDVAQIPAFSTGGHVTDLTYFTWTTGDIIPDCYYGRFSAQNVNQLLPQIEKTLQIEQYTMPNPAYLSDAVLVAGNDASFGPVYANGQVNYLAENYVNTHYGFVNIYTHLHPCSSQAAQIRSELNVGVGYANYTAHCGSNGWADPAFQTSHIPAMNNANKYGFFIGNCCQSSKFEESECFGESLLRTANKGAYGYIGGSDNTYWDGDYYWSVGARSSITVNPVYTANQLGAYDRLFHTHNEPYSSWFASAGALVMGGNLAVQSSNYSAANKQYYWEIYNLMGDPSVLPYLSVPAQMPLSCLSTLITGANALEVNTVPFAYVALTSGENLIAAVFANADGLANLSFSTLVPGEYEVAVSAQNYITRFVPVNVIVASGPYVTPITFQLSTNTTPSINSTITCKLVAQNLGIANATGVYAKISTTSPYITLVSDSVFIGNIAVDQEITLDQAFQAQLASFYPDQTPASLTVTLYFNGQNSTKNLNINLLAPKFSRYGCVLQEIEGNQDHIINPGESFTVTISDINIGHEAISNVSVNLISQNTKIMIDSTLYVIPNMAVGMPVQSTYTIHFASTTEDGDLYPLYYRIKKGEYELLDTLYFAIGQTMEDFESNTFLQYPWNNSGAHPWSINSSAPYAGAYSARSASNLGDNNTSILQISLNVAYDDVISFYRKVSSEQGYDFFKFFIDDEAKEELSGTVAWSQVSFPVPAGQHTFRFEYVKDYSVSNGSDCAWIDNIIFPAFGTLIPDDTLVNFATDGITEQAIKLPEILLYPNPAQDVIQLSSMESIASVSVYDLKGSIVMTKSEINNQTLTLNISSLSDGFYLIKIEMTDKKVVIKKVIKG
ncbi:MAG: C25 family cysteine peptidase [Bacteroidales bacterium]|jgi:hypothetical protein|nr:C25 family cysteine peptidase [Bacteroidales bacterium]